MKFRPDDSPEMELGETRNATFKLAGAVGTAIITGTPIASGNGLTLGTVTNTDTTISVPITASQTGTFKLKVSAEMDSDETLIGVVRVKVIDSTCGTTSGTRYN